MWVSGWAGQQLSLNWHKQLKRKSVEESEPSTCAQFYLILFSENQFGTDYRWFWKLFIHELFLQYCHQNRRFSTYISKQWCYNVQWSNEVIFHLVFCKKCNFFKHYWLCGISSHGALNFLKSFREKIYIFFNRWNAVLLKCYLRLFLRILMSAILIITLNIFLSFLTEL